MNKEKVALVRYQNPHESVRKAVDLCEGLSHLSGASRVFIKPNIVFWCKDLPFPKWGVITTSRVVEDMVILLKEHGVNNITLGEGTVLFQPKDRETPAAAFQSLGYPELQKRYGVNALDIHQRPFVKVDLGDGVELNFNEDFLQSDFVVNIPVLKTHAQTVVSLGIKNLKGLIDIPSRKKCHSPDPERNLHFMVSKLANKLPRSLTIIDGIYSTERGPAFDGKVRRSNLLIASKDVLAADKVGARVLGYEPADVPYLALAARDRSRPLDLSDVEVIGEKVEDVAALHEYSFPYNEDDTLPVQMAKMGIKGVSYPKYDLTMCTYCSLLTGGILMSIAMAWRGEPWNNVEILTGKVMQPTPGKKTILLGKCLWDAHRNHPHINEMIAVKACPPPVRSIVDALHQVGIPIDPGILENMDKSPAYFMRKYENKPEFDESLFKVG